MKTLIHILLLFCGSLILAATSWADDSAQETPKPNSPTQEEAQKVISHYLRIADESGTNYLLAIKVSQAAEKAQQPGILEWSHATAQLRLAEWALMLAAAILIIWAAFIFLCVWRRWKKKPLILTTLVAALTIAACLWSYHHWTPPLNDAVITYPSTTPDGKMLNATHILISPFDTAEVVGSLELGSHVTLDPQPATNNYLHITSPDTNLTGWIPQAMLRKTGE